MSRRASSVNITPNVALHSQHVHVVNVARKVLINMIPRSFRRIKYYIFTMLCSSVPRIALLSMNFR